MTRCRHAKIDVGVSHKMADDADLEAIRARRMAELQAQYGGKV